MSMNKKYDVLVAGELNVDIILNHINKFPQIGKEVLADRMTITLGSSSAIFASNLSVLGTRVTFAGTLAHDQFGELILASLMAKGVATDHIVFTNESATGATIALSFDEDRAMVTYPGAMTLFTMDDIDDDLFRSCRHLHVSSIFLSTGLKKDARELFQKAKRFGLTTSLDPQWDPHELWDIDFRSLLPYVDVFIPNESELMALTGIRDIQKAAAELTSVANILIVKSGREGAYLWKGNDHLHQRPFLNDAVVDSIGAGDSFGAGFIHKFVQGKPLRECLEFAALTGAINTTRAGGTTAFENLELVRSIAQSTFHYKF
jgi:sugar/nucleoside kinase (ribokinase family)